MTEVDDYQLVTPETQPLITRYVQAAAIEPAADHGGTHGDNPICGRQTVPVSSRHKCRQSHPALDPVVG